MNGVRRWRGRGFRSAIAVAIAGSVVGVTALPVQASAGTASPPVPRIVWSPCNDGFQCAQVQVPLDYDAPRGPSISLALVRLPAADPAHRVGSLFVNPGGPGGSGVDIRPRGRAAAVRRVGGPVRHRRLRPARDHRRSTPLLCFDSLDDALADRAAVPIPGDPRGGGAAADLGPRPGRRLRAERAARSSTTCRPRTWSATRPAARGGGRPRAELPRLLLRVDDRHHLRQPLPGPGARRGDRRGARSGGLDHRATRAA